MSESSNNLNLPYILPSQAQKHVTHNEALRMLDAIVQLSVLEKGRNAPPTQPQEGERYLIGPQPTGLFQGNAGKIAAFQDGAWSFFQPKTGWIAHVVASGEFFCFNINGWEPLVGKSLALQQLGVNTNGDANNRLSVKSNAVLFSHDDATPGSGDMRLGINKAGASKTASVLFQSNWSGRAEFGLAGSDGFSVKVSPDGNKWNLALEIDPASGRIIHKPGARHSFAHDNNLPGLAITPSAGDPANCENGDLWYNATSNKFRKKQAGIISDLDTVPSSGTTLGNAAPPGVNGDLVYNDNGVAGGATALHYDKATGRFGIGTIAPATQLELTGSLTLPLTTASAGTIFRGSARFLHAFGTSNAFLGEYAGNFTMTGVANVAMGRQTLSELTSGGSNVAVGDLAMRFATTGLFNVAAGTQALYSATTSQFHVAIGAKALYTATISYGSVAIGYNALLASTGNLCTAIGYRAGADLTSGTGNTLIGSEAGLGLLGGSNNTIIGPAKNLSPALANTIILADGLGNQRLVANTSAAAFNTAIKPASYTVATLPSASVAGAGAMVYVSNESGGGVPAFSDGSNWRRVTDRVVVS